MSTPSYQVAYFVANESNPHSIWQRIYPQNYNNVYDALEVANAVAKGYAALNMKHHDTIYTPMSIDDMETCGVLAKHPDGTFKLVLKAQVFAYE